VLLAVIAVIYTTPWDNYLVANRVWWYDPSLVLGITLGWVPLEEYAFFVVQSLLTGFLTLILLYRLPPSVAPASPSVLRRWATLGILAVWALSAAMLVSGWQPGTYLSLILIWALPAVALQFAFGADILVAHRRTYLAALSLPTIYLWLVDYLAISAGTWTIDPEQTTGIQLGVLPLEEMVFFLATNVLVAGGVTLIVVPESRRRARRLLQRLVGIRGLPESWRGASS
jgi:lycopene cyclase domain-containing protein